MKQLGEIVSIKAGQSPSVFRKGTVPYMYLERHNNQNQPEISKGKPLIVSIF